MVMTSRRPGYVLIIAVLIIGLMAAMIGRIVNQVVVFNKLQRVLIDREQARMYALSGIEIASAQLAYEEKEFIKAFPTLNRWQQFEMRDSKQGTAGMCEIYVVAEQGKINLNKLYDFKKKQFIKEKNIDGLKILQTAGNVLPAKGQIVAEVIGAIFKERGRPLDDLFELFGDKRFKKIADNLMPVPEKIGSFTDLFTLETKNELLQPLLLSPSMGKVLSLKEITKIDKKAFDTLKDQLKNLTGSVQWQQKWDTLIAPIYGKQYASLAAEIKNLFAQEFETLSFSVVSYGKFGNAVVKVYAILQQEASPEPAKLVKYCIKKLYWL